MFGAQFSGNALKIEHLGYRNPGPEKFPDFGN
jgi:hypothetical protein